MPPAPGRTCSPRFSSMRDTRGEGSEARALRAAAVLALLCCDQGDWDEAAEYLSYGQRVDQSEPPQGKIYAVLRLAARGRLAAQRGEIAEGLELARRAVELAERSDWLNYRACAWLALAEVQRANGQDDRSRRRRRRGHSSLRGEGERRRHRPPPGRRGLNVASIDSSGVLGVASAFGTGEISWRRSPVSRSGSGRRHPHCSRDRGLRVPRAARARRPASAAPAKRSDTVTIGMLITVNSKPGWDLVIPNFERAYPNIKVDVTYAPNNAALYQLELTQLAAGNAPELLATSPGCGTPIAICALAKAGHLAPMLNKPWASKNRSPSLLTSYGKFGQALVGFVPQVAPYGIFTNDSLFKQLGLEDPPDVLAAPRRLQEGEGRRNGGHDPRRARPRAPGPDREPGRADGVREGQAVDGKAEGRQGDIQRE